MKPLLPMSCVVLGGAILGALALCEAGDFGAALPVLMGAPPSGLSVEEAVVRAGALIVSRLLAVFLAPVLIGGGALALVWGLGAAMWRRRPRPPGAKGPTPKPVGSTGGGL